jgi:hypothetical protein
MGRASLPTLLPLDCYARVMGIDPRHFNGVVTTKWPATSSCQHIWFQYAWQNADAPSREDLAEAIHQAERDMARTLDYFLAPAWTEDELQRWTPTHPKDHIYTARIGLTPRGLRKSVRADWGMIVAGGVRAVTAIAVPTTIANIPAITWTWSDQDGDGENDTLIIGGIPFGTVTDPDEIAVYFPHGGPGLTYDFPPADERYRIRPVDVHLADGEIWISRWLLVRPELWEGQSGEIDGLDDANFLNDKDGVDVYRLYNDPSTQAEFRWEPLGDQDCAPPCGYWDQDGCLGLRDPRLGLAVPYPASYAGGIWSGSGFLMNREPDAVALSYLSGDGLEEGLMKRHWQRAVSFYATALLHKAVCGCEALTRMVDYWRDTPSLETEEWTDAVRKCPFGPQRGAVFAWRVCMDNALGRGIAM